MLTHSVPLLVWPLLPFTAWLMAPLAATAGISLWWQWRRHAARVHRDAVRQFDSRRVLVAMIDTVERVGLVAGYVFRHVDFLVHLPTVTVDRGGETVAVLRDGELAI